MLSEEIKTLSSGKIDWSLWISLFALTLSLLTYILHDRRLKKQEHLINDYQLKKISQEKDEDAKALVKADTIKHDRGQRIIKIFNAGKSTAKNVNVEILSGEDCFFSNDLEELFPYEFLHPQEHTKFIIHLFESPVNIIKIRISWDDNFSVNNKHEQLLTL